MPGAGTGLYKWILQPMQAVRSLSYISDVLLIIWRHLSREPAALEMSSPFFAVDCLFFGSLATLRLGKTMRPELLPHSFKLLFVT